MSGLFNRKPAFPRYIEMWDPQIILDYVVGPKTARKYRLGTEATYTETSNIIIVDISAKNTNN